MKIQDFVVLDLETTGLSVKEDQILEIGAVKVQGGEVTASYETFVNPGRKVPERITELTGIRDEMIANAPDVETAVRGFLDFCGGLPLLGHNILFDYSFIKQAAINARLDFEKEAWDTLKIARKALPDLESRSLEALCGYYQIPREHAHRAMDDVLETLALFRKLEEGFSEDHPEWFAAAPLKAKMKREVPATEAQKKYLVQHPYQAQQTGYIQPYADCPLDGIQVGEDVYISIVNKADRYCWFMTPYLIITDEMTHALSLAAKRGVDVRIITPGIPDKKLIYSITRSFYHNLVQDGVRIYEWTPGFCHAKMSVADDCMATCGTINLDYRSLYHHFENGCFMADCDAVLDIRRDMEQTLEQCREVTEKYKSGRSATLRLGQLFLRLFAELL